MVLFALDQSDLFGERAAKLHQHFDQQIDLCKAVAPVSFRAEKEFQLDDVLAVGDDHHIVAPLVRPFRARLDVGLYVRGQMS